ncbi:hypothetical protein COMNV_00885 [Commensalibacter sp. Nvir]|uniref:hypothetical protein n=1 Tax=Commensalibacter sp. Nvir TaxID=3069817 RepID=UPI002D6E6C75|nr:hypothetical protein COMNV_00885 [Commensalibacter sp. Nvir]
MDTAIGGIYLPHLKHNVIAPVLAYLNLGGEQALHMVTGTFVAESYSGQVTYLKQLGKGPALGACQMEPFTYNDIWNNFLNSSKHVSLANELRSLSGTLNASKATIPDVELLTGNLFFAAAMCRVFYLRIAEPLPKADDATALANYHKKHYNTSLGKANAQRNIECFQRAIDA